MSFVSRLSFVCFWVFAIAACGPKSVGVESDTDGGEGSGSDDTGSAVSSANTTSSVCELPMVAACVNCECDEASDQLICDDLDCNRDCSDDACGETCFRCPDGEDDCLFEGYAGVCVAGQCLDDDFPDDPCNGELQEGFESGLSLHNGCRDILMYARNETDTIALTVNIDGGLVDQVRESGEGVSVMLDLSEDAVDVLVLTGLKVGEPLCNDVGVEGSVTTAVWVAVVGQVSVMVGPPDQNDLVFASVALDDITLENEGGAQISLPHYEWQPTSVGWLPG